MANGYYERLVGYAQAVVDGREVAGKLEKLACRRFFRDVERAGTDAFPYVLDHHAGARVCRFMELLPHIKGEWAKPIYVDGKLAYAKIRLEAWQVFTEYQLFGWKHRDTGLRRFRRSYEEVARKNAKSTRAAARELYLLTADGEPGAHCYSAATTGDQAREVFDVARNMALREPEFLARFGVEVGKHDITIPSTASSFKPLNAEGSTLDGLNIHGAVVDELHAHKTRAVWDVIDTATGARSQALVSAITTAGSDLAGVCYELRDYTVKVLEGTVDDETWFGVIYTLDEDDLWHDPKVWRKANPNLGVSVKLDALEAACRKALASPAAQGTFKTKLLNIWVNADSQWMDMDEWRKCGDPTLTIERVKHLPCAIGLDLASKVDVAAKVYLFRDDDARRVYLIPRFWLPQRAIDMARNSQYAGWQESGYLQVSDGSVIDFDAIEDTIAGERNTATGKRQGGDMDLLHELLAVAYDPYQATQFAAHMIDEEVPMVEMRQTVLTMSEPMKELEALVLPGKPNEDGVPDKKYQLVHDGNPMMTWMMSNVVCHKDAKDNIYPRKQRDENKIDGPVGAIMALARLMVPAETANVIGEDYVLPTT
jgi:phage terminase large subunit-like protein